MFAVIVGCGGDLSMGRAAKRRGLEPALKMEDKRLAGSQVQIATGRKRIQ
jgi:hypothetical protein